MSVYDSSQHSTAQHSTAQHSTAQHRPETRSNSTSKSRKPKVVITSLGRVQYFEWFLLGFYCLQEAGEISLEFDIPLLHRIVSLLSIRGVNRMRIILHNDVHMDGYIVLEDGRKRAFTFDCCDNPYQFDEERLINTDTYFKMQCPIDLSRDSFALTDTINIPWIDYKHADRSIKKAADRGERLIISDLRQYIYKIKPLMIGTRQISKGLRYKHLRAGYDIYMKSRNLHKSKKFMCYFGNALGHVPSKNVTHIDYSSQSDILGFFGDRISHPNEKRARVAEYLSRMGEEADARVISTTNPGSKKTSPELFIPFKDFFRHVSHFQYNVNVSGYSMSIPSRFIDSFIVGTAIVTDKLAVKWYLPFDDCEVFETVKMGYERMDDVDWAQFERDVMSLPDTDPAKIVDCFNRKWAPEVVARYIIDTVRNS